MQFWCWILLTWFQANKPYYQEEIPDNEEIEFHPILLYSFPHKLWILSVLTMKHFQRLTWSKWDLEPFSSDFSIWNKVDSCLFSNKDITRYRILTVYPLHLREDIVKSTNKPANLPFIIKIFSSLANLKVMIILFRPYLQ